MKHILLALIILALVLPFASATTISLKEDFQTNGSYVNNWISTTSPGIKVWDTYGHSYAYAGAGAVVNRYAIAYTYAAYTQVTAGALTVALKDSTGASLYNYVNAGAPSGRYEFIITSGVCRVYRNGAWIATSGALATNPYYFYVQGATTSSFDDFVVGYVEDPVIIGSLPSDWFIMFSASSPASTGLYMLNPYNSSAPFLKNSNYFGVSYGRGSNASTTLRVTDPTGSVMISQPVTNSSGELTLPISSLASSGIIRNGLWRVSLADSATSGYFWVMGSGASGAWSQESYTQGDTATFSYTILDSSWNAGTSTYRFDVLDVYGNVVDTQSITTQTGSKSVTTDSTKYPSGVYYGAVIQTTGGEDTWLAADAMEVSAYIKYVGGIYDAESEAQITSNVTVTINQGSIADTTYTTTGVYNSTDGLAFGTGSLTTFTVSASGYQTSVTSFTPLAAKTIVKNITLIRSSPTCPVGICLGGLANETVYSRPVPAVTIAITNATYGESYTTSTNSVGWYNLGESDGVFFTNGRCYSVTASKPGYTGNTYLKCVVGT